VSATTTTNTTTITAAKPSTTANATLVATVADHPVRFDDDTAHCRAVAHATAVLGLADIPSVAWDDDHVLQGHLCIAGLRLVLVAARTADRVPHLFSEQEWNGVRHRQGVSCPVPLVPTPSSIAAAA
jgi:hypothetical protein